MCPSQHHADDWLAIGFFRWWLLCSDSRQVVGDEPGEVLVLRIGYRVWGSEQQYEILVSSPAATSEAVALLWILQSYEEKGAEVEADWTERDVDKLREQVQRLGVVDVIWSAA